MMADAAPDSPITPATQMPDTTPAPGGPPVSELEGKLEKMRSLLESRSLDAVLLRRAANFAWATCGAGFNLNVADVYVPASLLITSSSRYLITDNIEGKRFKEELHLDEQGWEFQVAPWYEQDGLLEEITRGLQVGSDSDGFPGMDVQAELARLRSAFVPAEIERLKMLSRASAEAMDASIMSIQPGWTEQQIAGLLAREVIRRGMEPIVTLVGVDERLLQYRSAVPTERRLKHHAMVTLCARRWGLAAAITRAIHFGKLPDELRQKESVVAHVDAHYIAATRPGRRLDMIFHDGAEAYQFYGFPGEWRHSTQGGQVGYMPREALASPQAHNVVAAGQAYAWSPSVAGVRSEDTILVGEQDNDILTAIPRWPHIKVNIRGRTIERPRILEVT